MLSIGRVSPGNADYYLRTVALTPDGYYLGDGEAPGAWTGSTTATVGVAGAVDPDGLRRMLAGCHPDTAARLVADRDGRVGGFDLTFSAPKTVSILWALHPDPAVRAAVADAHHAAISDALSYLETDGVSARRGQGGQQRVPVDGILAARFDHMRVQLRVTSPR